jgi:hypothetical protein
MVTSAECEQFKLRLRGGVGCSRKKRDRNYFSHFARVITIWTIEISPLCGIRPDGFPGSNAMPHLHKRGRGRDTALILA